MLKGSAYILENFNAFCDHLLSEGVSLEIVNAIRNRVNEFTSVGQDPSFHLVNDGVIIEGKKFIFHPHHGLGFVATALAIGTAVAKMLPPDFIGNTFGAIMSNGFRLGCWNTSSSPAKAKEEISIDAPYLYKLAGLENSITIEAINKFVVYMEAYIASRTHASQQDYAECTKDGHKAAKQMLEKFYEETMLRIKEKLKGNKIELKATGLKTIPMVTFPLKSGYAGNNFRHGDVRVPVYEAVSIKSPEPKPVPQPAPKPVPQKQPEPQPAQQPQSNGTATVKENQKKSNTVLIAGGIALATVPFFFMKSKKSKK